DEYPTGIDERNAVDHHLPDVIEPEIQQFQAVLGVAEEPALAEKALREIAAQVVGAAARGQLVERNPVRWTEKRFPGNPRAEHLTPGEQRKEIAAVEAHPAVLEIVAEKVRHPAALRGEQPAARRALDALPIGVNRGDREFVRSAALDSGQVG